MVICECVYLQYKNNNNFVGEAEIVSVFISAHNMHDLFSDGSVCNQWEEYVAVLIYK